MKKINIGKQKLEKQFEYSVVDVDGLDLAIGSTELVYCTNYVQPVHVLDNEEEEALSQVEEKRPKDIDDFLSRVVADCFCPKV